MKFVDTLPASQGTITRAEKNQRFVEKCKQNPGKWTIIQSYDLGDKSDGAAYVYANQINSGSIKSLAGLRAAARKEGSKFHVWVSYPVEGQR